MAAVHAVEIADRHHGARKRSRFAAAHNKKGFGGRFAHRAAGNWRTVTGKLLILAAWRLLGRGYG
jgi:hypothetical protein